MSCARFARRGTVGHGSAIHRQVPIRLLPAPRLRHGAPMTGWRGFLDEGRRAGGVIRLAEAARRHDLVLSIVQERARAEGWWRPFPGVVGLPGVAEDAEAWCRAACLHVSDGREDALLALTRHSALHLYGLVRTAPTRTQVVVPAGCGVVSTSRLQVIRSRDLQPADVTRRGGKPVATGPRLVRDLAPVVELDHLRNVVVDLVQRRITSIEDIRDQLPRWPRFPGRPRMRTVLDQLSGAGRTDAGLEYRIRAGLRDEGIPLDRGQVAVALVGGGTIHLDLGIAAIRFGIEAESMLAHSERRQLLVDVQRSNALARLDDDWRVLRCTWEVLGAGWSAFAAEVREVVAAQSRRHLGVPWPRPQDVVEQP
jgi:hypothetical protein